MVLRVIESYHLAKSKFQLPDYPLLRFEELVFINLAYLFVLWAVVRIMRQVEHPFELKQFRLWYNFVCVVLSAYTAWLFISDAMYNNYGFVCNNSFPNPVKIDRSQRAAWIFLLTKFFELQDTIIMALRKSFRQITFLHVFHHMSISFGTSCFYYIRTALNLVYLLLYESMCVFK